MFWVVVGAVVWNGFFDLYVARGAREYLQLSAEAELGRVSVPSMDEVMARNQQAGWRAASYWALFVVCAGWSTVYLASRTQARR